MLLTTLGRVRELLKFKATDVSADPLLSRLIVEASASIESYIERSVEKVARTQDFDVENGQKRLWLPAFPIASVASVYNDVDRVFPVNSLIAASDYVVYMSEGKIDLRNAFVTGGPLALRITYTGGIATDVNDLVLQAPDLALATEMQVAYLFQRKNLFGATGANMQGGSVSLDKAGTGLKDGIIPEARGILDRYRRFVGSPGN